MNTDLTSNIVRYMKDDSARYAIALEGDWGSGKTRYIEKELTDKLYRKGFDVLRVSLFGVTSVDEAYSRVAMAMIRLAANEDDGHAKRFFKGLATMGAQAVVSFGTKWLSDKGISVEASPQMLTGALSGQQLIVFDDFERCGANDHYAGNDGAGDEEPEDDFKRSLYGFVNNLVEAQGCKVMFVTNSYDRMPAEFREKVVWKCYRFRPSPEDLVRDIIIPEFPTDERLPEFDVSETIISAAKAVTCRNARAMLKATELLKEAVSCEAMSDERVDVENRKNALRDFAQCAFLAAMSATSAGRTSEECAGKFNMVSLVNLHSSKPDIIEDYFDPRISVTGEDVSVFFKEYIELNYEGSPETMELSRTLDKARELTAMEDDEVASLAAHLSECITKTEFDLRLLVTAMILNATLRDWGFREALSDETLLKRAEELVCRNPLQSYLKLHDELNSLPEEWADKHDVLLELGGFVVRQYEQLRATELDGMLNPEDPSTWKTLEDIVRTSGWCRIDDVVRVSRDQFRERRSYLDYDPKLVAKAFECGNASLQDAVLDLYGGLTSTSELFANEQVRDWASGLRDAISGIAPQSRMGKVRRDLLLDELERLLDYAGNESHRLLPT